MMLSLECIICAHKSVCKDPLPTRYLMFCFPLVVTLVRACTGIGIQEIDAAVGRGGRGTLGFTLTSSPVPRPDFCHGWVSRKLQIPIRLVCAKKLETGQVSAQNLGEGMAEQLLSTGSVFGLHKNAADEIPCLVRGV